jgi:succinoglycan biosynthesis protein ExoA
VIERVLADLLAGFPQDRPCEIVVADGGSTDGTIAHVAALAKHEPRIRHVANPARLQGAAVNLVARQIAGTAVFLVRADAHATYPPQFVADVVSALERTGADAVVVPMDSTGKGCVARATAWVSDTRIGSGGSAHRGGQRSGFVDHGHHAAWRLDSFLRAGGYDESFSHNEDAEFDCRLLRDGGRVWLDANIRLQYHVRPTLAALWRQYRNYGRGRSRTIRRHPGTMRLRQFIVPTFVGTNLLALLLASWWWPAVLLPTTYLTLLALVSLKLAIRHRSPCGILSGAAALVMHVAWALGFVESLLLVRERPWRPRGQEVMA